MDDDVVREVRERQDMVLEVKKLSAATTTKRKWEMTLDGEGERETARKEGCARYSCFSKGDTR